MALQPQPSPEPVADRARDRRPREFTVRLPAELYDRLEAHAGAHYRSKSSVVLAALAGYLREKGA